MRFPGNAKRILAGVATGGLSEAVPVVKDAVVPSIDIPEPAPLPEIPEPAVMPVPDDAAVKNRRRRKSALTRLRSGRASTINTAPLSTVLG